MSTEIILKKSSVTGRTPNTSDLKHGEVALNFTDGRLYYKTSSNTINYFNNKDVATADSATVIGLIDSNYVQARVDSSFITTIIDSGYIQARDRLADSAFISTIVDSAYVQLRDRLRDSNFVQAIVDATTNINDSAEVTGIARRAVSVTDAGGDGSLGYNNSTGVITYTGPSASETRAHFSGGTGVSYNSGTGAFAIGQSVGTGDTVTFAAVNAPITGNVTGNIQGNVTGNVVGNVTGNLDGVVGGNTPAAVTGTTITANSGFVGNITGNVQGNVTATSGTSTFQNINVDSDVVISGNLTVQGTQTTINSTAVTINDLNLVLADSAANAAAANNAGITINGAAATLLYKSASDKFQFNKGVIAPNFTGNYLGFDSDFNQKSTTNLSEGSNLYFTNTRVSNLVDSAYVNTRVKRSDINLLDVNAGTLDGQDGVYFLNYNNFTNTPNVLDSANVVAIAGSTSSPPSGVDSAATTALVDSSYVQGLLDSSFMNTLVNDNYVAALVDSSYIAVRTTQFLETTNVPNVVDSAYVAARQNGFTKVAATGALTLEADGPSDTLTFVGGSGITLSTNTATDTLTISGATANPVFDFGTFSSPVGFTLDMGSMI